MRKYKFWIGYAAFVAVLLVLCVLAVGYAKAVLLDYEAAQPEKVAEQQMELIRAAAQSDTLEEVISFQKLEQAEYDIDISDFREYKAKLKNAKEWSYKIKNGYSETEQQFYILADDEKIAVLTLKSVSEEIKLAILTINEWQVQAVTPILTLAHYDYKVNVPTGFKVTINGTELINPVKLEMPGWECYKVETLYSEPEIKIYDSYGAEAVYDIVNNEVTPVVHTYNLRLPEDFSVYDNGKEQKGVKEGEEVVYHIITLSEVLTLTDAYGSCIEYQGGDSIYTYDYVVKIPDNFKMTVNGKDAAQYLKEIVKNRKYQYVEDYTDMPGVAVYEMKRALCEPQVEIKDNLGQPVACNFENFIFEQTDQTGQNAIPEEVLAQIDVLEIAKMWSKFMTEDLEGSQNGFGTIKQYLIKDSYLYNVAYKWATGIDITFTFSHVFENPPFTDEKVSNYVSYNETMFSCDVYFVKHMKDTAGRNGEKKITDSMNSTFYFMYHDETDDGKDNPHWVILDIQDILSE